MFYRLVRGFLQRIKAADLVECLSSVGLLLLEDLIEVKAPRRQRLVRLSGPRGGARQAQQELPGIGVAIEAPLIGGHGLVIALLLVEGPCLLGDGSLRIVLDIAIQGEDRPQHQDCDSAEHGEPYPALLRGLRETRSLHCSPPHLGDAAQALGNLGVTVGFTACRLWNCVRLHPGKRRLRGYGPLLGGLLGWGVGQGIPAGPLRRPVLPVVQVIHRRRRLVLFSLLLPKRKFLPGGGSFLSLSLRSDSELVRPGADNFLQGGERRFGRLLEGR